MPSWINITTPDAHTSLCTCGSGPSGMAPFAVIIMSRLIWLFSCQISTQRAQTHPGIGYCIILCIYPSSWMLWNRLLRHHHRFWLAFSDIDSARPNLPGNWLLHHFMRISVDSRALETSPSPSPPFLASSHLPSQIST
jgi:hypothetical protein